MNEETISQTYLLYPLLYPEFTLMTLMAIEPFIKRPDHEWTIRFFNEYLYQIKYKSINKNDWSISLNRIVYIVKLKYTVHSDVLIMNGENIMNRSGLIIQ